MRELDTLLVRYLEDEYPAAGEVEKAAFERVLTLSDPQLLGYLLKREECPDPAVEAIVDHLRR